MRYLIVADIHSNLEALEAVIRDAHGAYDQVVCCGDVVGYGADPDAVTDWVRKNAAHCVRGNHDKVCAGMADASWFNSAAARAAAWTQEQLSEVNRKFLCGLPEGPLEVGSFLIAHGSPLDEDDYIVSPADAANLTGYLDARISFFAHTHLQGGYQLHRNGVISLSAVAPNLSAATVELENDPFYLLNPGSVGQPRDGDPRAAYLVYEPARRVVHFRRVVYDIGQAQRKIVAAGLPELLASRLADGQ